MKNFLIILLCLSATTRLLAFDVLSYKDIFSNSFDRPSPEFQVCFSKNFESIKADKSERIKFFTDLKNICNPKTLDDKKYIIKSCIINGYLMELKAANKNHNLQDSIEYAQAQIIDDCKEFLSEIIPQLSDLEKNELNALIPKTTT
ncbi:MAG: hypothetical protein LBQ34_07785, partial [Alphaproteobacteria bacterium]|nr:hypothetical protein [Alphaproteobacteria bacterium]